MKPIIKVHDDIFVVRDDLVPGGTKSFFIKQELAESNQEHFVYPGTAYGAAIVAFAAAANESKKYAHIFSAERKIKTDFIEDAEWMGGDYVIWHPVKMGYYSNVSSKAKKFAEQNNYHLFPCGFRGEFAVLRIAARARLIDDKFDAVFSACASGTLQLGLQMADIGEKYFAIGTGMKNPFHGKATLIEHYNIQKFEQKAKILPPFPTVPNYDGKVWQYAIEYKKQHPNERVLFWNVAATRSDIIRVNNENRNS